MVLAVEGLENPEGDLEDNSLGVGFLALDQLLDSRLALFDLYPKKPRAG
jgi:hypothetical protein